jgi:hypothetical protein
MGHPASPMTIRPGRVVIVRGQLGLAAAPRQPVCHILEATGLIDVFSVYPGAEEAAKSRPRQACIVAAVAAA